MITPVLWKRSHEYILIKWWVFCLQGSKPRGRFQKLFLSQHPSSSINLLLWNGHKRCVLSPLSSAILYFRVFLFMTHNQSMLHSCSFLFSRRPSWSCNGCSTWSRCVHFEHGSVVSTVCSLYVSPVSEWRDTSLILVLQLTDNAWRSLAMGSHTHSLRSLTFASAFHFDWFLSRSIRRRSRSFKHDEMKVIVRHLSAVIIIPELSIIFFQLLCIF